MTIYEIGSNFLKISTSSQAKSGQFFEETEKIPLNHGLSIHADDFLKQTINEIGNIHHELAVPGKMAIILPYFLTTSRIFHLPVSAKNKINMMTPFQLDESLPAGSQSMHWIDHSYKLGKNSTNICLSLINKDLFEKIYLQLKEIELYPAFITSEFNIILNLFEIFKKPKYPENTLPKFIPNGNFVILNMGEHQTTAYFFSAGQLTFNHYSNIGGINIDENISDNYEISLYEAKVFKEESGFLFTQKDYELADTDQKIFAKLMEKTLEPLILDFSKWDLAFRSKTSQALDKCFIVGGLSKMQNIENFLSEQLEVPTECLALNDFVQSIEYTEFFAHQAINVINQKGGKLGSFLKDNFKLTAGSSSYSENSAFFSSKTLMLSLVLICFLSIERVFIEINNKNVNKSFRKILSAKTLNLGKREQISYRRNHDKLNNLIKPRLDRIGKNKKVLEQPNSLPIGKLLDHLTEIKSLNNIRLKKVALFDGGVSSHVIFSSKNTVEKGLKTLKKKFGKDIKKKEQNIYEITIRN